MRHWLGLAAMVTLLPSAAMSQSAYFPPGASGPAPDAIDVQSQADQAASYNPAPKPQVAPPEPYQDVSAGGWSSVREVNDGATTCGVHGKSSAGDPLYLFATTNAQGYLTLQMSKPVWSIPANTPIHLHAAFDNGVALDLTGSGDGIDVKAPIRADQLKPWVHGFTAANNMVISFVGAAAASWGFSLTGTTPTIGAMAECAKEANIYLPAPYNTGTVPMSSGNIDGQPFAALSGQPQQTNPAIGNDGPLTAGSHNNKPTPAPASGKIDFKTALPSIEAITAERMCGLITYDEAMTMLSYTASMMDLNTRPSDYGAESTAAAKRGQDDANQTGFCDRFQSDPQLANLMRGIKTDADAWQNAGGTLP